MRARATAGSFANSLKSWNSTSGVPMTHLSKISLCPTRAQPFIRASFHPPSEAEFVHQGDFWDGRTGVKDATKMGNASLRFSLQLNELRQCLGCGGLTVTGLQYSSYSGQPSTYFVRKSTPPE